MSRFSRMVVLPEEEYRLMKNIQSSHRPLDEQFKRLNTQYEEQFNIEDPSKQSKLQSHTLEEMKNVKHQMQPQFQAGVPKQYRTRATGLHEFLKSRIQWNERGELLNTDTNQPIANSQIEDLIQHAVRDKRRSIQPAGWEYFIQTLRRLNVPKMVLGDATIHDLNVVGKRAYGPSKSTSLVKLSSPIHTKRESLSPQRPELKRKRKRAKSKPRKSEHISRSRQRSKKYPIKDWVTY